jgi:twitching motility protein PilT
MRVTEEPTPQIDVLFQQMERLKASDLHLKVGNPPIYRISGDLRKTKTEPITDERMENLVKPLLAEKDRERLDEKGSCDVGYDFEGGRVRVNIFKQRGHLGVAARLVTSEIPTLKSLHLPEALGKVCDYPQGLVLVCGPTGCGKSTTLAALIDILNHKYRYHVLTIEDPIEYLYTDDWCIINQREMGLDCDDWTDALRGAVREDPDVILVGEMRDHETFQAALQASETGHLVFGTIHSSGAAGTIGRILDLFPPDKHLMIRRSLAFNLRATVSQRLVPSCAKDVEVVPAVELMFNSPPIQKAIRDGEDQDITAFIAASRDAGMQTWTDSFANLVNTELVERRVALEHAPNREELEMALRGIRVSASVVK